MAAGSKVLEYIIGAKDATASAIKSAVARVKSFASSVGRNLMNIQAGFQMLGQGATKAMAFLRKAFEFETMTVQFKTLVGGMDEARAHMKMLQELGDTPPFSLEQFAAASRSMMVMTDGALGYKKSLELVGDAAAATGQPIETLAHEVGRAYAIIRDGQPLTRATMALRNMGVLTPEVAARLDDLQKAGASNAEIWAEMEKALGRYSGAMAETEQTGNGLIGAISSQWDNTMRGFGEACLETAKDALGGLLDWIKRLNEDGTIGIWAQKFGDAMKSVGGWAKEAAGWIGGIVDAYKGLRDWLEVKGEQIGAAVGTMWGAAGSGRAATTDDVANAWNEAGERKRKEQADRAAEDAQREEAARASYVEKQAKQKANSEKKAADEAEKIQKQMAAAQAKQDAKRADELKKAEQEAAKKREEEEAKARQKEEAERLKLEEKISRQRIDLMQKELTQRQKDESDAQSQLSAAQAKVREAWGWYRDKDSLKAQLAEEKANAEAEKQFEKDFDKLKDRRRDWRTADNLSLDDEAVRRVGLAREAEAEAQKRLDEIAENTRALADKVEELMSMEE